MSRTVSVALANELDNPISEPGHLVQVSLTSTLRMSDIGQVTWNALTWLERSFTITGMDWNSDSELKGTLSVANNDGVIGALVTVPAEKAYLLTVTIYYFARGALGVSDVPLMATMAVDSIQVSRDRVIFELTESNTDSRFSPRRRIAPTFGFKFATPAGTVIPWGGEIYEVEPSE